MKSFQINHNGKIVATISVPAMIVEAGDDTSFQGIDKDNGFIFVLTLGAGMELIDNGKTVEEVEH